MTVHRDTDGQYVGLICNTCAKPAPPVADIMAAFGLSRMGWHCSGGSHICPDCPQPAKTNGSTVGTRGAPAHI